MRVRQNHIWKSRPKRNGKEKRFPHYINNARAARQIFINTKQKKIRSMSPTCLFLFAYISASPLSHTFKNLQQRFLPTFNRCSEVPGKIRHLREISFICMYTRVYAHTHAQHRVHIHVQVSVKRFLFFSLIYITTDVCVSFRSNLVCI